MKPKTARAIHFSFMVLWGLNLPVIVLLYFFAPDVWQQISILYLAIVSIYANFVGHWSGLSAERPTEIENEGGE